MSKGNNQKLKLLYLAKYFAEHTDTENGVSIKQLIEYLASHDIPANRKTLYQDIEELQFFGYDIIPRKEGRAVLYSLVSRDFELPELKLLVDSVQSAKFMTEKKSRELIKKIESLCSVNEARQLHRQVIISGRVKTVNENILITVDNIHAAIAENNRIKFRYFQWNRNKEMELRHNGGWYIISPWALIWDDEYYYLLGYDAAAKKMKHYRVDKMINLSVDHSPRDGKEIFESMDLPSYSRSLFGMFGGNELSVTLHCKNNLAAAIIDRFGTDIIMVPDGKEYFTVRVTVAESRPFLGWIFALGNDVKILEPQSLVAQMKDEAVRLTEQYK